MAGSACSLACSEVTIGAGDDTGYWDYKHRSAERNDLGQKCRVGVVLGGTLHYRPRRQLLLFIVARAQRRDEPAQLRRARHRRACETRARALLLLDKNGHRDALDAAADKWLRERNGDVELLLADILNEATRDALWALLQTIGKV